MCENKKKSLGAKSGLYPSIRRFGRSKRHWFELMCESSHCHGAQWSVFSCSFFEFLRRLQTNKLWCSSGTVVTWPVLPKKQATICFKVLLLRTTVPHVRLLFCFGLKGIDPWFVICDDCIFFISISMHQSNCAGSNEKKPFLRTGAHAISNVC